MAINYTRMAATAKRLIEDNGRPVVIRKLSETAADSAKPWRGTTGADTTVNPTAVILDYRATDVDGERIKRGDQRMLVAATSLPANTDLRTFDRVEDTDGSIETTYRIVRAEKITPGTVDVYWDLQLRE